MHGTSDEATATAGTTDDTTSLDVPEVARRTRLSERWVWYLIANEELESFKSGKRRLVLESDLADYLRRQKEAAKAKREHARATA